jgi:hypothetical protein
MSNLGTNTGESGIFQSKWLEHEPEQTEKVVSQAWKEQYALINALYEGEATQEEFEDDDEATKAAFNGYHIHPEGEKFKGGSKFDNTELLKKVKEKEDKGNLQIALDHLSSSHDGNISTFWSIFFTYIYIERETDQNANQACR